MAEHFLEHVSSENRKLEGDDLPLNAALRHGRESEVRATIRHKEGYPVKVRVRAVPLGDEFGKLLDAAESFESTESVLWDDERKNMLAIHGCMDRCTGALTREYTESADRANAARRLMQLNGIRADQVTQVRGFADQRLRKKEDPSIPPIAGFLSSCNT